MPTGMGMGTKFCLLTLVSRVRAGDVRHRGRYGFALPVPDLAHCHPSLVKKITLTPSQQVGYPRIAGPMDKIVIPRANAIVARGSDLPSR